MCLTDKHKHIFASDNKNLVKLCRAACGDKNAISNRQNSFGMYKKPPVPVEKNALIEKSSNINPGFSGSSSNPLDANEIFWEITEINPSNFLFNDLILSPGPDHTCTIKPDIDEDKTADNKFLDSIVIQIDDWMNLEEVNDLNPNAGKYLEYVEEEEEIEESGDERENEESGDERENEESGDERESEDENNGRTEKKRLKRLKINAKPVSKPKLSLNTIIYVIFGTIATISVISGILIMIRLRTKKPDEEESQNLPPTEEKAYFGTEQDSLYKEKKNFM